ncbi:MAG: hypothetical protein HY690_02260 [Chloroflexi bacterium]|nr:hypothetical protein [Chloroflexota bacterium]
MAVAKGRSPSRIRVQFDLRPDQMHLLELLEQHLAVRSRADLLQEAIGTLLWLVLERRRGRKVVSIDPAEMATLRHAVEWASPASLLAEAEVYEHLVARPHPWRRQLYLKGRNMTVGQMVATLRAEGLSPEDAAEDLDLPLAQVREALVYYDLHHDLVDAELREEKTRLRDAGHAVEPPPVPR